MINLDRPVFTYIFTYSMSSADSCVVLVSGKVTAFDGNVAAPKIAKKLLKQMQALRGESLGRENKEQSFITLHVALKP